MINKESMKRIISLIAISFLAVMSSFAQIIFTCDDIQKATEQFNLTKVSSNKKWATAVLKSFPLSNDGNISYKYTIVASDSIDVDRAMTVTHNWFKQIFKNPEEAIKDIDTVKHTFTCVANYGDAAQLYGMAGATFIQCPIDMKVEIYDTQIVIKMRARQYELRGVNYYTGAQKNLIGIAAAFPINDKNGHKESYAMAFINTNSRCINACKEYFTWLKTHYDEKRDTEDW